MAKRHVEVDPMIVVMIFRAVEEGEARHTIIRSSRALPRSRIGVSFSRTAEMAKLLVDYKFCVFPYDWHAYVHYENTN
jgi:hypothetical protein